LHLYCNTFAQGYLCSNTHNNNTSRTHHKMKLQSIIISCLVFALLTINNGLVEASTCSTMNCGASACCDQLNGAQCYDPSVYACASQILCPVAYPAACGQGCFNPLEYHCVGGQLQQGPATTPSVPVTTPPTAPTQAQTPAPTQAQTSAPTQAQTSAPTQAQTPAPTQARTSAPTNAATSAPTQARTSAPTNAPVIPTTPASSTSAPTTTTNSQACSALYCPSGVCCVTAHPGSGLSDVMCYDPTQSICKPTVLCTAGLQSCGLSCYNSQYFICANGLLQSL